MRSRGRRRGAAGAALVITLFAAAMLAAVLAAFLLGARLERACARNHANAYRARLALEAGFAAATARLRAADLECPVAAYEEAAVRWQGASRVVPVLVLLRPTTAGDHVAARHFLASSPAPDLPPGGGPATAAETVDINLPGHGGVGAAMDGDDGWIGLVDEKGARRVVPVEWIDLTDLGGETVGRYAYWLDDETARLDPLRHGGVAAADAGAGPLAPLRDNGSEPAEVALHGLFATAAEAAQFIAWRRTLGDVPLGLNWFRQAPAGAGRADWAAFKAAVGWGGQADERGAPGWRKIDLNRWAASAADFTTADGRHALAAKVVALGQFIDAALPRFGDRAGRDATGDDRLRYCVRIAANIQDYLDPDRQPTVIAADFAHPAWLEPPDPTAIGEGAPDTPPAAFGKEVVPAVGEYVGYYYSPGGGTGPGSQLRIDHTFEIWNIHATPIDFSKLGAARVLLAERPEVFSPDVAVTPDPELPGEPGEPPLAMALPAAATIPPGTHALLTTLPPGSAFDGIWVAEGDPQRIRLAPGEPTYPCAGGLKLACDSALDFGGPNMEIVVANEFGYLDIQTRVPQQGAGNATALNLGPKAQVIGTQQFGNDPSSTGNTSRGYPLDSGDPRSLTDVYPSYQEATSGTRSAIAWRRNAVNQPGLTKLGAHSRGSECGLIPDNSGGEEGWVPEPVPGAPQPPAIRTGSVIRDGPMETIGELGFIYDPAIPGTAHFTGAAYCRGGFRTLAIGSRLGDLDGPRKLHQVTSANRAYRLLELFADSSPPTGKVLLNSALRDPPNLPLRAVIGRLAAQENPVPTAIFPAPMDPALAAVGPPHVAADNLLAALVERARAPDRGPFLALGELGDLDLFNGGAELFDGGPDLTPNARNNNLTDRGREEVFRHLVGLLTLKGTRFRIYAIAQTGRRDATGRFVATGIRRGIRLVELHREYASATALDAVTMPALLDNNWPRAVHAHTLWEVAE